MKTLVYDGKQLNIPKHTAEGKVKSLVRHRKETSLVESKIWLNMKRTTS